MTSNSDSVGSGDIQDLAVAVEQLTEAVRLLYRSTDELRDDVVWAARQCLAAGYGVTGMPPPRPIDPLAPDADLKPTTLAGQGEDIDTEAYCCERPRLKWNGDPDAPGIACENCGYVVAEFGQVAIWRDEADSPATEKRATEPEQRQGSLFE